MAAAKKRRVNEVPGDEANFRALYRHYKRNARKRKITFSLSIERFRELTKLDCLFCGTPPSGKYFHSKKHSYYSATPYIYSGIDRMDNKVGYKSDNCAPCCSQCNYAKASRTLEDFLLYINRIYNHAVKPALNEGLPADEQLPDDN